MRHQNLNRTALFFFAIILSSPTSFALPTDSDQPLSITADTTVFNYKTGENIYIGHVKIDQGTSHVLAERVVTKNNKDHKIGVATAYGDKTLAEYITIPKEGDQPLDAKANVITFYPPTSTAVLTGNVIVRQGENNFKGPTIVYNIKDQIVNVPPTQNGQATIIIDPKSMDNKDKKK